MPSFKSMRASFSQELKEALKVPAKFCNLRPNSSVQLLTLCSPTMRAILGQPAKTNGFIAYKRQCSASVLVSRGCGHCLAIKPWPGLRVCVGRHRRGSAEASGGLQQLEDILALLQVIATSPILITQSCCHPCLVTALHSHFTIVWYVCV